MNNRSNLFSNWSEVTSGERNQLVFENRNQTYGAYEIRNNYDRTLLKALSCAFIVIVVISSFSFFSSGNSLLREIPATPPDVFKLPPITPPDVPKISSPVSPPSGPRTNTLTAPIVTNDTMIPVDSFPLLALSTPNTSGNSNDTGNTHNPKPSGPTGSTSILPFDTAVVDFATDMPVFPGGESELLRFLRSNTVIPEPIKEIGRVNEKLGVTFIIDRDGSVTSASILKGGSKYAELNREAIRVINKMPKWEPGKQNGNKVKVRMILPFRFEVK